MKAKEYFELVEKLDKLFVEEFKLKEKECSIKERVIRMEEQLYTETKINVTDFVFQKMVVAALIKNGIEIDTLNIGNYKISVKNKVPIRYNGKSKHINCGIGRVVAFLRNQKEFENNKGLIEDLDTIIKLTNVGYTRRVNPFRAGDFEFYAGRGPLSIEFWIRYSGEEIFEYIVRYDGNVCDLRITNANINFQELLDAADEFVEYELKCLEKERKELEQIEKKLSEFEMLIL